MHQCGILDEFGNKLCYPIGYQCPINYITLNNSDKSYNYKEYSINGIKIYYTNEAIEDGKVLGGFFVDSDLMIKYNVGECQIIDTSNISELLNSHKNILYRNSLNFDPYKDESIDTKGKAYLKWCIPGVGKERNLTLVKKLNIEYEQNKTTNKNLIDINKYMNDFYFISLPGYIIVTITFSIITISIYLRRLGDFVLHCIALTLIPNTMTFIGNIGLFVIFPYSFNNIPNFYQNIFKYITIFNIIILLISIFMTIFFIAFFCYLCHLQKKEINLLKSDGDYKCLDDKKTSELQSKNVSE